MKNAIIADVADIFYPYVDFVKYEAWNITDNFKPRARVFFQNMNRIAGKPLNAFNRSMIDAHKDEILKTPPKHFVNVWLNTSDIVRTIKKKLKQKKTN